MPKVSVYVRPTAGNRTPTKATKGSTTTWNIDPHMQLPNSRSNT
jgi:hypothetical protein